MTCKDCVHYSVCVIVEHSDANYDHYSEYGCEDFKNKADFAKVKHGKWHLETDGSGTCSICGTHQYYVWDVDNWQNFCGHCGADMRGEINKCGIK